jgi:hypothetical protein
MMATPATLAAADRLACATFIRLTQGPSGAPWIEASVGPLLSTAGLMPLGSLAERQALARRIVACLQVCQGLSTEAIEAAARDHRRPVPSLYDRRQRAVLPPSLARLATA